MHLYYKDLLNGIVLIITTSLLDCSFYQLFSEPNTLQACHIFDFLNTVGKERFKACFNLITVPLKTKRNQKTQNQIKNPPMPNQSVVKRIQHGEHSKSILCHWFPSPPFSSPGFILGNDQLTTLPCYIHLYVSKGQAKPQLSVTRLETMNPSSLFPTPDLSSLFAILAQTEHIFSFFYDI